MIEILVGQIPEAIYFSLFLIFTKNIKEKRIIFTVLMILEYLILKYIFPFNIYFQVSYCILTFLILKLLYKEKAVITDIFIFGIASLVLILASIISYLCFNWNMNLAAIVNRVLLFIFIALFHDKLYNIQNLYKHLWNRNDKVKKRMKSTTFRALNIVIFNFMFYIINLGLVYAIIVHGWR